MKTISFQPRTRGKRVQLGDQLLRRLGSGHAAIHHDDVAKLAIERTAARELHGHRHVIPEFDEVPARHRCPGDFRPVRAAINGLQPAAPHVGHDLRHHFLGLLALMYDEFGRALERLERVREVAAVGKLSGAVGTSAHLSPAVEAAVCKHLGLQPATIATQVVQRDIHAEFMTVLALVGASIERWAVEFRHLQRTEVLEVEEPFTKGQKGSSAMPHKRNPITWERLTGLARVLRGNAVAALENVALWHERDISHSSVERIIFPDSCTLLDYMFGLLTRLMDGLNVYPENMKRNLGLSLGMWNSQTVLLALIRKGLTREAAYNLVQDAAMKTWEVKHDGRGNADFVEQLKAEPAVAKYFKKGELEKLCSLNFHFKEVKNRFKKLGL